MPYVTAVWFGEVGEECIEFGQQKVWVSGYPVSLCVGGFAWGAYVQKALGGHG